MNAAASTAVRTAVVTAGVVICVALFMWSRCGLRGCPDIARLNGYVPDRASVLTDHTGREIGRLFTTRRAMVRLADLPGYVPLAFVAMEDHRFWEHGGIDWIRVVGATYQNLRARNIESGSSTITMQVARNVFPERLPANHRTIGRKLSEARVARLIEKNYSKHQILELYVNQIYFGHGAYGIQAAAEEYFGKPATQLTLAEVAVLAALPRAPSRLNPRRNPELALRERRTVLDRMVAHGQISADVADRAAQAHLRLRRGVPRTNASAPYFVSAVRRQIEKDLGDAIYTEGYTIETTLDLATQRIADEELREQLCAIEAGVYGRFPYPIYADALRDTMSMEVTPYLQAALVFMDPRNGDVRALIGGRDYVHSQFNRALRARRQPASLFKPFVFAAAVADGYPASMQLDDQPVRVTLTGGGTWTPHNEDGIYAGTLTMRQALAVSSNVATVRLATRVGLPRIIEMAHRIGVNGPIPPLPSIVLGSVEMTPLEVTEAYAAFATLGQRPKPRLVTRVLNARGKVVWEDPPSSDRVLDPSVAFVVTDMMKDVINRGSATSIRDEGYRGVGAGKTGTSTRTADAWFVGYTPELVGTIWLGFDQPHSIVQGGKAGDLAAPIWGRVMTRLSAQNTDWSKPSGVETRLVDDQGNVYANNCRGVAGARAEYYIDGTAPHANCAGKKTAPSKKRQWLARFWKR